MSVFDQRGQNVNYQYNASGNINFGTVDNREDLVRELENLKSEVLIARDINTISSDIVTDLQYQLQKAVDQAQKSEPDKNTILKHLSESKNLIKGVVDVGGLVTGIMKAMELVENLF